LNISLFQKEKKEMLFKHIDNWQYKILCELYEHSPHFRRRCRRRAKNNFDRIYIKLKDFNKLHGPVNNFVANPILFHNYMKLNDKLRDACFKLNFIDSTLNEINAEIIKYNNGSIVPFNSLDYIILKSRNITKT
jgi:hypothetical protein